MTSASALPPPVPLFGRHAESYRLSTPHTTRAPKLARDFFVTLIGAEHPDLVTPGSLCMSELVTNAIRHTRSPRIAIEVSIGHGQVVVYVHDNRPCPLPVPTASYPEPEHGRGLALVEAHADIWGTVLLGGRSPRSKAVWFSFRTGAQGASRQAQ